MNNHGHVTRELCEGPDGVRVERIQRKPQSIREASAVIKHYNPAKGYGFVGLESGRDAYFGRRAIASAPGAIECGGRVRVRYLQGERRLVVSEFVKMEPRRRREVTGIVTLYKPGQGFGFIQADDGGPDVYVNGRTLARSGLEALKPGEPVEVYVVETDRGRHAQRIRLLTEA